MIPTATENMQSMLSAMSTMSADMSRMSLAMATAVNKHAEMDMSSMSSMPSMSGMSTTAASASTATSVSNAMAGMDMSSESSCKVSMLWNWNTIDSCFLSSGWRITSSGKFAGTCIGVFLWVVFLVALGSTRRRFDKYIASNARRRYLRAHGGIIEDHCSTDTLKNKSKASSLLSSPRFELKNNTMQLDSVRPNVLEQLVRAVLFGFEYSITWLLGLILMSYNGYVIISAFLGAMLGFMFIEWNYLHSGSKNKEEEEETVTTPLCC